jgi:hypothetical protein
VEGGRKKQGGVFIQERGTKPDQCREGGVIVRRIIVGVIAGVSHSGKSHRGGVSYANGRESHCGLGMKRVS